MIRFRSFLKFASAGLVGTVLSTASANVVDDGANLSDLSPVIPGALAMLDEDDGPPPPPPPPPAGEARPGRNAGRPDGPPPRGEGRPGGRGERLRGPGGPPDGGPDDDMGPRRGPGPGGPPPGGPDGRPPLGHPLIRMIAPHNPQLAGRLERLRRESPEKFDRILAEALVRRLEETLDAEGVPPGEPLPPEALGGPGPRGRGPRHGRPGGPGGGPPPVGPDDMPPPPPGGPGGGPPDFDGPDGGPPDMGGPDDMRPPRGDGPPGPGGPHMRNGGPGRPGGPPPLPPELRGKWQDAEQRHADATRRVDELVRGLRESGKAADDKGKAELQAAVVEQFEARTALRLLEIERHELDLKLIQQAIDRMKGEVERRGGERDDIVRRRMEALLSGVGHD